MDTLLQRYAAAGAYADCYTTKVPRRVSQAEFVAAFYSTPLFKIERLILKWAVGRPSTDAEAVELGGGTRDRFAAWKVEARSTDQLLLCDFTGRTRSWLMSAPIEPDTKGGTRLYFGSAVVPRGTTRASKAGMGFGFGVLLGFHRLYSRLLLGAACRRLLARP